MKDFIKVGLDFVRGHPDADQLQLNIRAEKNGWCRCISSLTHRTSVEENGVEDDSISKEKVEVEFKDEVTTKSIPEPGWTLFCMPISRKQCQMEKSRIVRYDPRL